jgi:hypothetical protein
LKKIESYVKLDPVKLELVKLKLVEQEPYLKEKVLKLEQTIEMLIKLIEGSENNQVVKAGAPLPVVEPVLALVVAPIVEPLGIDDVISHRTRNSYRFRTIYKT